MKDAGLRERKRPPRLAIARRAHRDDVALDGPFRHANAELEQLASDSLRTPRDKLLVGIGTESDRPAKVTAQIAKALRKLEE